MTVPFFFFDLDGTLNDSGPGIRNSARFALQRLAVAEEDINRYTAECIGPPLRVSFQKLFPDRKSETEAFMAAYREYYTTRGMFENSVYPGVEALLQTCASKGAKLFVATSKAEPYARKILEHFGLSGLFCFIGGDDMAGTRNSKAAVLRHVINSGSVQMNGETCLMVGDRRFDVEGAHAVGMPCCGVLYGYGDKTELEQAGADDIVETVAQLQQKLLKYF